MMNSVHCDEGSVGAPITSDTQLSSIIDDHHANFTMKGKNFKRTIQKQLQELGATFEEGMSVLEELQNTSYEKQKLHANCFCASDLPGGLAGRLRDENRFLREIETKLRQRIEQLQDQLDELHGQLETRPTLLIDQQSHSDSQTNTVENKLELNRQNETTLEVENAQLREELKAKMGEIDALKQQVNNKTVEMETLRQQMLDETAEKTRVTELETQNNEMKRTLLRAEDCKQLLIKRLKRSEQQTEELRGHIAELEKKQTGWSDACNDLDRVVKEKDAEIVRLNSEMNSLKGALMKQNAQISALKSLQDQLTDKMGEIIALKQQVDNKTQENANYKTELQRVNTDYSVQVEQLKQQVEQLQEEVECAKLAHEASLKEAYLKVCKEIKIKKPDNVNTMEEVHQWTQKELQNVVKEREMNRNKVQELEGQIQLQREQNERESAVKTLQDQLNAKLGEIDALKQQVNNKTVEMETLRQQMLDGTAEMTRVMELETQNNEMKRSLRQAEDCKQLLQKRLKKNDQQAEELRGHIAELEKKQKGWSDACNDLDRVVKEKDAEIARLKNEMNQLKYDVMRLKPANKGSQQSPTTTGRDSPVVIVDEVPDDVMGFIRRSQTKRQ